jgi:putative FmdB family regulatory protein
MPIYQLRCGQGHEAEVVQSFTAPLPPCPSCGSPTRKIPAPFGIAGLAARRLPPPAEAMPQTWRGTYEGDRDYLRELRRTAQRRQALEERHPELAGDRRPVLAHEGRFAAAPLRAGDPLPPGTGTAGMETGGGQRTHRHDGGSGHAHRHGGRDSGAGAPPAS